MLLLLLLLHPLALAMVDFSPSAALDLCCPRVSRLASRVTYTAMLQNTCNEFVGALKPKDPPCCWENKSIEFVQEGQNHYAR